MSKPGDFHKGFGRAGSKSPASKLNEEKVLNIKAQLRAGITCTALAKQYKVAATTIERINRGETWTHVKI